MTSKYLGPLNRTVIPSFKHPAGIRTAYHRARITDNLPRFNVFAVVSQRHGDIREVGYIIIWRDMVSIYD